MERVLVEAIVHYVEKAVNDAARVVNRKLESGKAAAVLGRWLFPMDFDTFSPGVGRGSPQKRLTPVA